MNSTKRKPITSHSNTHKGDLILTASNPKEALQLLKSEAEKLLEEGWEVIRVSKRSIIAVQDGCEIYLHICSKGIYARIFTYDN